MPLVRLKDGTLAETPEGTSDAVHRSLGATVLNTRSGDIGRVDGQDDSIAVEAKAKRTKMKSKGMDDYGWRDKFTHSYTMGIPETIANGVSGLIDGVRNTNIHDLGNFGHNVSRSFQVNREIDRQAAQEYDDQNPIASTLASVGGAVANPLGAELGIGKIFGKLAPTAAGKLATSAGGKFASRVLNSNAGLAARATGNQMAVEQAVNSDSLGDVAGNAAEGYGLGALMGGGMGTLMTGAGKAVHAWTDRAPAAAGRVAYTKIADLLSRSPVPGERGVKYTPESAVNEMKSAVKGGSDPILADLSNEMQLTNAHLARKPGFDLANQITESAEGRMSRAGQRWEDRVQNTLNPRPDAHVRVKNIKDAKRATGAEDYAEGSTVDNPIPLSPEMEKAFADSPDSDKWLAEGFKNAQRWGFKNLGHVDTETGKVVPSGRVYDEMLKAARDDINDAIVGKQMSKAGALSAQLERFKKLITDANPDMARVWSHQRDAFQQLQSASYGEEFLRKLSGKSLGKDARQLLDDISKEGMKQDDLKLAVADALIGMRAKGANPSAYMQKMMRTPSQRLALKRIFGDNKTLADFEKFIAREERSFDTDRIASTKRQSATNALNMHADANASEGAADTAKSVLQGAAFGGKMGALSRGMRSIDMLSRGMGPDAQRELALILQGRGEGLVSGVGSAKKFLLKRAANERRNAIAAGKAFAGYVRNENAE